MSSKQKPVTPVVNRFFCTGQQTLPSQSWRDLYWLTHTPALLAPDFSTHYPPARFPTHCLQQIMQWMHHEQQHPQALAFYPEANYRRLGLYAEHLLKLGLAHCPSIKLLLHHHPIHLEPVAPEKGRKTLGEVDYIWEDSQTGKVHHWELAVKLYLYLPQTEAPNLPEPPQATNELHRYVGTQLHDTLHKKTQRLLTHQLTLSSHEQIIGKLGRPVDEKGIYLKGWLFYPLKDQAWDSYIYPQKATLDLLNPAHNKGWWLRLPPFMSRLACQPDTLRWLILPRLKWLSEAWATEAQSLNASQLQHQLMQHFLMTNNTGAPNESSPCAEPLLLVALQEHPSQPGLYEEIHRGFVTGDTWARA